MVRNDFLDDLAQRLDDLRQISRYRELAPRAGIDLSSNDYLGLADHPIPRRAVSEALTREVPLGSGGSRLLRGNTAWHEHTETQLARFKGSEAALIFNSGYDANTGVLTALCGPEDVIFSDSLNHASLIDGIRMCRADKVIFPHNDMVFLEEALARMPDRRKFIVVESLYSMEGDRAPLDTLARLADRFGAQLIVDEAHATGIYGPHGAGLADPERHRPLVTMHTCGKAMGGFGAFVCCSELVKHFLVNFCRRLIFTTALPPVLMAHWRAVLDIFYHEPWRRERVLTHTSKLRAALRPIADTGHGDTHIIPIILGEDALAVATAARFQEAGYDIRAIRPPTVPPGTARLRISLNARLDDKQLKGLIETAHHILPAPVRSSL